MTPSIDSVWPRIKAHEGDQFTTTKGLPFTYTIAGDVFHSSRATQNIPKSEFAKALALFPLEGPGAISKVVRGSSYVWAVLHDARVSLGQW